MTGNWAIRTVTHSDKSLPDSTLSLPSHFRFADCQKKRLRPGKQSKATCCSWCPRRGRSMGTEGKGQIVLNTAINIWKMHMRRAKFVSAGQKFTPLNRTWRKFNYNVGWPPPSHPSHSTCPLPAAPSSSAAVGEKNIRQKVAKKFAEKRCLWLLWKTFAHRRRFFVWFL